MELMELHRRLALITASELHCKFLLYTTQLQCNAALCVLKVNMLNSQNKHLAGKGYYSLLVTYMTMEPHVCSSLPYATKIPMTYSLQSNASLSVFQNPFFQNLVLGSRHILFGS